MPVVPGPGDSGRDPVHAHMLGPHVVGRRVVVRRLLHGRTGPTGGPAFTDVLGVCESWADGRMAVRREDDSVVEIATADIVSGKPVPPRPSARGRVSPREAEAHLAALAPGMVRRPLGEWELRVATGATGAPPERTDSCLAIGDPGMPMTRAADAVTAFYREHGRPPLAQVEAGSTVEAALAGLGWVPVPGSEVVFVLGSLARASRSARGAADQLDRRGGAVEISEDGPRATVRCLLHGEVAGSAAAAYQGDWLGVHSLVVHPAHRRHGVATALVRRLLEFGAETGCLTAWAHAPAGDGPALALADGLGLAPHHTCRHLAAP